MLRLLGVMLRLLGYWGPKVCEILYLSQPSITGCLLEKIEMEKSKERDLPKRSQIHTGSFSHLRATEPDNKPVDPAT